MTIEIFREHFGNKDAVALPVVHVADYEQAIRNVKVAFDAKADGVFLINHGCMAHELFEILFKIRDRYPDEWIGANFLGIPESEVFWPWPPPFVDGIWSDGLHVETRDKVSYDGLYFGGFAFKYRAPVDNLEDGAKDVRKYLNVVTTSGSGTGTPPTTDKISRIRYAIGDFPMAIASGITPENVKYFLPFVNAFLVATGISKNFENLDYLKTKQLCDTIHNWDPAQADLLDYAAFDEEVKRQDIDSRAWIAKFWQKHYADEEKWWDDDDMVIDNPSNSLATTNGITIMSGMERQPQNAKKYVDNVDEWDWYGDNDDDDDDDDVDNDNPIQVFSSDDLERYEEVDLWNEQDKWPEDEWEIVKNIVNT
jgi:hypothetical protein